MPLSLKWRFMQTEKQHRIFSVIVIAARAAERSVGAFAPVMPRKCGLIVLCILISQLLPIVEGCIGLGCCGGGFGGCGGCGCGRLCAARARVASAKTLGNGKSSAAAQIGGFEADAYRVDPDDAFRLCCAHRRVPPACMTKCSYSTYTKDLLRDMFFHVDACPIESTSDIHFCASRGKDHTQCCQQHGVADTAAGPRCMIFCEEPHRNTTQLDFGYLPCYERFDAMKSCFWHDALRDYGVTNLEHQESGKNSVTVSKQPKTFTSANDRKKTMTRPPRNELDDEESLF